MSRQTGPTADITLGANTSNPTRNISYGLIGASLFGLFLALSIWKTGVSVRTAVPAALILVCLWRAATGLTRRRPFESPATVNPEGFTLRLGDRDTRVPWDHVALLRVYEQPPGEMDVVLSLVAFLDRESPYTADPTVACFRDLFKLPDAAELGFWRDRLPDERPIWLGEITDASEPMETVLAALRDWAGPILDGTPRKRAGV
ncbi:hypothetical protein [Actinoallomurus acaciae]|uniref:Uncharacterized protein n=1 Tax=Actinoallomurus acaciae TaxID=502577 RepID=A0ABV5Y9X5_9ACTN